MYSVGAGKIEVSENGVDFFEIPNVLADQLFPTQGYIDVGPQDSVPGQQPDRFLQAGEPGADAERFQRADLSAGHGSVRRFGGGHAGRSGRGG